MDLGPKRLGISFINYNLAKKENINLSELVFRLQQLGFILIVYASGYRLGH